MTPTAEPEITDDAGATRFPRLAQLGRRLFPFRLVLGVVVALVALEFLTLKPFFSPGYRVAHVLALAIITGGLSLRAWGAGSAGRHTRSGTIEAVQLATGGPFAYLRNPIYAGSICLGLGMSLLIGDPAAFVVTGLVFVILFVAIIPAEEAFLQREFGAEYETYLMEVPRLIPRLRPWPGRTERPFQWRAVFGECGILLVLCAIYSALLLEEHLDKLGIS